MEATMIDDFDEEPPEAFYDALGDMLRSSLALLVDVEPDAQKFIESYTHFALADRFDMFNYIESSSQDERRQIARMFAIQIWNNTPLPSNHYRPRPITKPGRNDPCFCGSGKKYKQCCAQLLDSGEMPGMHPDMMTHYLLEVISKASLKQVWKELPHPQLGFIAGEWAKESEELAERALLMLDPIFKQDDAKLDHRDEMAFDTIVEICSGLNKLRKKNTLVRRIMQHPNKTLRAAALHRQCCILADQGNNDEAWECFQQAQRVDPNNLALSHLEILLLMQQGKTEQMQQRGRYWIKRLGGMNREGELDSLINMIKEMISDAPGAMGALVELNTPGAGRLIAWLKASMKAPPALINKVTVYDDASVIEPINRQAEAIEQDWIELMISCDDVWERPDEWLSLLETHPELAGSTIVLDGLTKLTSELDTPNPLLTFEPLLKLAMLQIKDLLPHNPKAPLQWGFMENRPALRVLGFLVDCMQQLGDDKTALEMMEWLLKLNPNDNQGYRSDVVNAYLRQNRNRDAISLSEHYPEDIDVSICFGHALALFRLNERAEADKRLVDAVNEFPKVAKALLQPSMKEPKGLEPGLVTFGGDDEAWYYREAARDLWLETPGATAWLKEQSDSNKKKPKKGRSSGGDQCQLF